MRRMTIAAGLFILLLCAMPVYAAVTPLRQPVGVGSQLIFYYDTRDGFTTFVNIRNIGGLVRVQLDFWGPTFATKVTQTFELPSGAGRVIDAGALKTSQGLGAQQGLAFATIVDELGRPIHVSESLMGNFTVANLATASAWGGPAAARSARRTADDSDPPNETVVDGTTVAYQPIQPFALLLATYYDPQSLAPVEAHGNQVIFANFKDPAVVGSPVTSASTTWQLVASRGGDGQVIANSPITVSGVSEIDVVALLGEDANGAAGGAVFITPDSPAGVTRLIFFMQSLGTFAAGYLLPSG